ncbi:DUF1643 domain-containing protein [Alkalihalobacillus sp. MEB203]|uniref:DUF1643 domain-containing protein n=1 Tax=Alkalihalobacterium chitinilyticum TaxID=2980103 RepID=A0ABT5VNF0_9BACI|nr:DUF1643 domain-containing protein [Alkalihalobacterium chitinilyticum]
MVVFVMLNPSTANAEEDDTTTKRCIKFAQKWGCGSLEIVNLFAYRATKYEELKYLPKADAIGPENEKYLTRALDSASLIVIAWGENCTIHQRHKDIPNLFAGYDLYCLGQTKQGFPRHPLYISYDEELKSII